MIVFAQDIAGEELSQEQDQKLKQAQLDFVTAVQRVQRDGQKVLVLFEGPNAAGKTSTIHNMSRYISDRAARIVALPIRSDVERGQWFLQRYIECFPKIGEIVFFDRSWYNRITVDPLNGFCSEAEYQAALLDFPAFEAILVRDGMVLIKLLLQISQETQRQRFDERYSDLRKSWKMKPIDEYEQEHWEEYQRLNQAMLEATDVEPAGWIIIDTNDRMKGRIACYQAVTEQLAKAPEPVLPRGIKPPIVQQMPGEQLSRAQQVLSMLQKQLLEV